MQRLHGERRTLFLVNLRSVYGRDRGVGEGERGGIEERMDEDLRNELDKVELKG